MLGAYSAILALLVLSPAHCPGFFADLCDVLRCAVQVGALCLCGLDLCSSVAAVEDLRGDVLVPGMPLPPTIA